MKYSRTTSNGYTIKRKTCQCAFTSSIKPDYTSSEGDALGDDSHRRFFAHHRLRHSCASVLTKPPCYAGYCCDNVALKWSFQIVCNITPTKFDFVVRCSENYKEMCECVVEVAPHSTPSPIAVRVLCELEDKRRPNVVAGNMSQLLISRMPNVCNSTIVSLLKHGINLRGVCPRVWSYKNTRAIFVDFTLIYAWSYFLLPSWAKMLKVDLPSLPWIVIWR